MSFFDDKISDRLGGMNFGLNTTLYKFARIKAAKAEAKQQVFPKIRSVGGNSQGSRF